MAGGRGRQQRAPGGRASGCGPAAAPWASPDDAAGGSEEHEAAEFSTLRRQVAAEVVNLRRLEVTISFGAAAGTPAVGGRRELPGGARGGSCGSSAERGSSSSGGKKKKRRSRQREEAVEEASDEEEEHEDYARRRDVGASVAPQPAAGGAEAAGDDADTDADAEADAYGLPAGEPQRAAQLRAERRRRKRARKKAVGRFDLAELSDRCAAFVLAAAEGGAWTEAAPSAGSGASPGILLAAAAPLAPPRLENALELGEFSRFQRQQLQALAQLYGLEARGCGRRGATLFRTPRAALPAGAAEAALARLLAAAAKYGRPGPTARALLGQDAAGRCPRPGDPRPAPGPAREVLVGEAAAPLDESNRGHRLLSRMGWNEGSGLGAQQQGILEPVDILVRTKRRGLGAGGASAGSRGTMVAGFREGPPADGAAGAGPSSEAAAPTHLSLDLGPAAAAEMPAAAREPPAVDRLSTGHVFFFDNG